MTDVMVIGAGPAGLSAAIYCRKWNLQVIVIDEFPKPGGRLLGQLHQEPDGEWWDGVEETKKLMIQANSLATNIQCGISCHNIEESKSGFVVHTNKGVFHTKKLLIATGATEKAAPIPGWTLPGVMSIGAAQVMTNVHRVRVGNKGIIVGVNALSAAIARELRLADVKLQSMALPAKNAITRKQGEPQAVMDDLARIAHLAPSAFLRYGGKFAKTKWGRNIAVKLYPKHGVKMWEIPIHIRKAVMAINGTEKIESVTVCNIKPNGDMIPGSEAVLDDVDFVCIAGGLYPLTELIAIIGCPLQYVKELGGHVPVHNERMETPVENLFVAGNITGIESSKVAISQGELAGLSVVKDTISESTFVNEQILHKIKEVKNTRENASIQFYPNIEEGKEKLNNFGL